MKKNVELLLPAGNIEKLDYAINYGADAVYMGMVDFSLRSMRKGEIITSDNLKKAVNIAHSYGKKVYMTLNIYAYDEDIKNLYQNLELIKDAKPDALIVSDFGILNVLKKELPQIDIHISTQTNTLNSEAVKFWKDFGATRVILARELSIKQIAEIKRNVPDIELESFVHGAQCVSLSGRCLLSDYMTHGERKANHGGCSQPCRWKYKLLEETRPGEYYEIEETARGTHILSTKDLALINYIPRLIEAGVDSFKIEGRTKSLYYVSAVAKAYRYAIDAYYNGQKPDEQEMFNQLLKIGNRGYTTGFYLDEQDHEGYSYDVSKGLAGADFLFEFKDKTENNGKNLYLIKIKNKVLNGDKIEIITPDECFETTVNKIYNNTLDEVLEVANTNAEVYIELSNEPQNYKYALARTIGIKRYGNDSETKTCTQFG